LQAGIEWELFTNQTGIVGYDWTLSNPPNLLLDSGCNFMKVALDGTATVFPLSHDCHDVAPVVDPADGRVAFYNSSGQIGGLYTGPAAGGSPAEIFNSYLAHWPAWSPDGTHLSFAYLENPYLSQGLADIFTINSDGTGVSQITALSNSVDGFLHGTLWSPDGNALIGAGSIQGTNGLWLIPLTPDNQHCDCPAILLPTSPGDPIDFAGSVIPAPVATVFMPGLFIRTDPTSEVVYWSTNYQGFALEYTTNLAPDAVWTNISGPYFLNGNYFEYREALGSLLQTKYFRLRYPAIIILTPPQPPLALSVPPGSSQTVLNWPTNYESYTLESATNLAAPAIWNPATVPGVLTNGRWQYREPYDPRQPQKFFRLRWP
jgi:hypothetical protein